MSIERAITILTIFGNFSIGQQLSNEQKNNVIEAIDTITEHYKKVLDMTVTLN